jgi:formate hydrogenlyase subunit 6/NADH:ubiquinone oxidoreductase subunit I
MLLNGCHPQFPGMQLNKHIIMKIELRYFTGTGNSLKVLKTCQEVFIENMHSVYLSAITTDEQKVSADLIGFCFPVYAFGIPRICRKYLNELQRFEKKQKVFILITAGDSDESGFSIKECEKILNKKNCDIVYTAVIQMPINWITSPVPPYPPSKDEAMEIIKAGVEQAKCISYDIEKGIKKHHKFNYPKRYTRFRFYKDYWLFKYMGLQNLWRTFKVYDTCNGCKLCSKICPTNSIRMIENKPIWASSCEQCMRCVNFCPNESIYQSMGGETIGKNRYYEPSFKPRNR